MFIDDVCEGQRLTAVCLLWRSASTLLTIHSSYVFINRVETSRWISRTILPLSQRDELFTNIHSISQSAKPRYAPTKCWLCVWLQSGSVLIRALSPDHQDPYFSAAPDKRPLQEFILRGTWTSALNILWDISLKYSIFYPPDITLNMLMNAALGFPGEVFRG